MVKIDRIEHAIDLPEGVTATIEGAVLTVKGPKGELSREYQSSRVSLLQDGAGLL
ncbi:MAG: 50S ribosomal protein L6, partial [Candidatus Thermoplasmatota archaeon]|nr:50S ribosomal protein L6 [Candidatus Thermoplasmatota archaeon]